MMNDTSAGGIIYGQPQNLVPVDARLAGHPVRLTLARTENQRAYGLMFRAEMPADEGMLFCYSLPQQMIFWMKNTILPLDLILFDDRLRISEVIRGMKPGIGIPEAQLPRYTAAAPAQYALEMASGTADTWNLHPGDQLEIPLPLLNAD
ncbi:MAG TPA: DUF192 domain-containing protein [Candidatus Ozemobacteraceae bacterium]|nr:DUF192 domain-containing protein [Candidatus Ozemobacteraceae bacterium]